MPSIHDGTHHMALERGLARTVARFERLPDAPMREVELHATLFQALQGQKPLTEPRSTADGRRTSLVHRDYPPFMSGEADEAPPRPHDVVLLNPRFVRNYPLEVVANDMEAQDLASLLGDLPEAERPVPLVAAVRLRLVRDLAAETLDDLATHLGVLSRLQREGWAQRCYMGIFCRHWDLDEHLRRALPALEDLAAAHQEVSLVVVQSYYDDAGRVFGGRYLNFWTYMAPLPPLGIE